MQPMWFENRFPENGSGRMRLKGTRASQRRCHGCQDRRAACRAAMLACLGWLPLPSHKSSPKRQTSLWLSTRVQTVGCGKSKSKTRAGVEKNISRCESCSICTRKFSLSALHIRAPRVQINKSAVLTPSPRLSLRSSHLNPSTRLRRVNQRRPAFPRKRSSRDIVLRLPNAVAGVHLRSAAWAR